MKGLILNAKVYCGMSEARDSVRHAAGSHVWIKVWNGVRVNPMIRVSSQILDYFERT